MDRLHDYITYLFAASGVWLSMASPYSGAAVVIGSLAYGVARVTAEKRDTKSARDAVAGLQHVVNSNAKRLEQLMSDFEKLNNDFQFTQNAKGLGLR